MQQDSRAVDVQRDTSVGNSAIHRVCISSSSRIVAVTALLTVASPWPARALPDTRPEGGHPAPVRATRATAPVHIDGRLDELAWAAAPAYGAFFQLFPDDGAAPNERTEVRVVYSDTTLYVGVTCYDSHPADIVRPLGRRDSVPPSDLVRVYLDSAGDRRTAAVFVVTAGGVQADALLYDDDQITYDWDAVWEGASAIVDGGWSAEVAIPFAILRYPAAPQQAWGFGVEREIGRSHERSATMLVRRNARGLASRLGTLESIDVEPRPDVEIAPYIAFRTAVRPQYSDPTTPRPRLVEPAGNLGVDFRLRIGADQSLTGTLNPDFGQVEADQIILNLSNFEYYFPEKRPFFTHGLDLFKSVGDGNEQPPQQLFYSRRIGLDSPILGATKLIGSAGERIRFGVLDALVAGTGQAPGATEATPDQSVRWSPAQPFQFAPATAYPLHAPLTQNFFAGVVRAAVSDQLVIGVMGTSAIPFARTCSEADMTNADGVPVRCSGTSGNALALDYSATWSDREWYSYGQAVGTQILGGPPTRILADGTTVARGDVGFGSYLRIGRRAGEPWRLDLAWNYATPSLDLTASGFQKRQNWQYAGATAKYVRPRGSGPWHEYAFWLKGWSQWTTDGRALDQGEGVVAGFDGLFKRPYLAFHCTSEYTRGGYDIREIRRGRNSTEGSGIPMQLSSWIQLSSSVETDTARAVYASVSGWAGKDFAPKPLRHPWYYGFSADVSWRPHPRTETKLGMSWDYMDYSMRYVDGVAPAELLFADLVVPTVSLTIRQMIVLTQHLTFQLYSQLFTAYARYGPFYGANAQGTAPIDIRDVRPVDPRVDPAFAPFVDPDFNEVKLNVNALLRWEYRPGWTLHLVYARNQAADLGADPQRHSILPRGLGFGPTTDSVLVKWTHFYRL